MSSYDVIPSHILERLKKKYSGKELTKILQEASKIFRMRNKLAKKVQNLRERYIKEAEKLNKEWDRIHELCSHHCVELLPEAIYDGIMIRGFCWICGNYLPDDVGVEYASRS